MITLIAIVAVAVIVNYYIGREPPTKPDADPEPEIEQDDEPRPNGVTLH